MAWHSSMTSLIPPPLCFTELNVRVLFLLGLEFRHILFISSIRPAQKNLMHASFNPISPDIKMHILLTVLHTSLMELMRRICLNVKTSYPW